MAPVCSNCNGTDFVWANEIKTGMTGASLSLRPRGEVPLGTRICRTCGHAELFLRDITILHQPHTWKTGEFIPIVPKPATKPSHHSTPTAEPSPTLPPVAPPPPPAPEPMLVPPPADPTPPSPPEPMPGPTGDSETMSSDAPTVDPMDAGSVPMSESTESATAKPKTPRKRAPKPKQ